MIKIKPIKKTEGVSYNYPDEVFNLWKYIKNTTGRIDSLNMTFTKEELIELRKEINRVLK